MNDEEQKNFFDYIASFLGLPAGPKPNQMSDKDGKGHTVKEQMPN